MLRLLVGKNALQEVCIYMSITCDNCHTLEFTLLTRSPEIEVLVSANQRLNPSFLLGDDCDDDGIIILFEVRIWDVPNMLLAIPIIPDCCIVTTESPLLFLAAWNVISSARRKTSNEAQSCSSGWTTARRKKRSNSRRRSSTTTTNERRNKTIRIKLNNLIYSNIFPSTRTRSVLLLLTYKLDWIVPLDFFQVMEAQ